MPTLIHYWQHLFKVCLLVYCSASLSACTSVASMPEDAAGLTEVSSCNFVEHMRCVYLTGQETIEDGLDGKWTRHWFRMSYIGKACERQHGRTVAVILESIFAFPHYFAMALGNSATALASPFVRKKPAVDPGAPEPSDPEQEDQGIQR